ncbi:hypothetical protein GCM10018790_15790 [Kitasatospora xanthocidica]|nr:hypothetical protein GCM10018790_15790 [Kitasatospora xanthocidica]
MRHVAHRIAVVRSGRIVESGPARRLCEAPADPCTRELLAYARTGTGRAPAPAETRPVGA